MSKRTELQLFFNAQTDLRAARAAMHEAAVKIDRANPNWQDSLEVLKVMEAIDGELSRMIRVERRRWPNPQNIRQAEDFALKAQLAKARDAVASVLKEREDEHSHK